MKLQTLITMDYRWLYKHLKKRIPARTSFIYSHLTGREYFDVPVGEITVRIGYLTPYHHFVARNLYHKKDEYEYLCHWLEHSKGKPLIYDIGGFMGIYGLAAAKLNPHANAVIFEPDPLNAALIRKNIALNELKNCRVLQIAISDADGDMEFISTGTSGSCFKDVAHNWIEGKIALPPPDSVQVKSLKSLPTPDLLKIDIEGHETRVILSGGIQPQSTLFLEVHTWAENIDTALQEMRSTHVEVYTSKQTQGTHYIFIPR